MEATQVIFNNNNKVMAYTAAKPEASMQASEELEVTKLLVKVNTTASNTEATKLSEAIIMPTVSNVVGGVAIMDTNFRLLEVASRPW